MKLYSELSYTERKERRRQIYLASLGWKQRPCTACSGSGRYDHNGSPKCGGCNGTGKERYKPETQISSSNS